MPIFSNFLSVFFLEWNIYEIPINSIMLFSRLILKQVYESASLIHNFVFHLLCPFLRFEKYDDQFHFLLQIENFLNKDKIKN
jgi:hypothetical protein